MKALPAVRRRVIIGLVATAALLTSGCAAGQHAHTAEEVAAIDGSSGTIGHLQVHNVSIAAPPSGTSYAIGDNASLKFVAVNVGQTDDQLTGITSNAAGAYTIVDESQGQTLLSPPSPTATPTEVPSGGLPAPVDIGAGSRVSFGIVSGDKLVVLLGLTKQLFGGNSISVTFTFANAGSVTVVVPVQLSIGQPGLTVTATGTPAD